MINENQMNFINQRQGLRVVTTLPVVLNFGTQITLHGQLKDIALKSAFIALKDSIYFEQNEKFDFVIKRTFESPEAFIEGQARISRIAKGEGIAIFFTKMDDESLSRLKQLINVQ